MYNLLKKYFIPFIKILYTTEDNHLNIELSKTRSIYRYFFLLTNLPYFYIVYYIYEDYYNKKIYLESNMTCKYSTYFTILITSFVSTFFHFKQCTCYNKNKVDNCILWNNIDISCVGTLGFLIALCYIKYLSDILYFSPCIIFMILGGLFKSRKQYIKYFIFHGLWHLLSALFLYKIICQ